MGDRDSIPSQPALMSALCCLPMGRSGSRTTADILDRESSPCPLALLTYKSCRNSLADTSASAKKGMSPSSSDLDFPSAYATHGKPDETS